MVGVDVPKQKEARDAVKLLGLPHCDHSDLLSFDFNSEQS